MLIKKGSFEKHEVLCQIDDKPKDIIVEIAIATILQSVEVEQIYLYHRITYGEKTTYYLLLIATGAGNEKLRLINQYLKSKTGGKYDFVLISHNRNWIQKSLYQHQSFFANIIQGNYLIHSSSKYHPEFHWEVPHNPYHADLYFYYKSTKDSALQFFTIANNTKENFLGLNSIFALFFLRMRNIHHHQLACHQFIKQWASRLWRRKNFISPVLFFLRNITIGNRSFELP